MRISPQALFAIVFVVLVMTVGVAIAVMVIIITVPSLAVFPDLMLSRCRVIAPIYGET